MALDIKSAGRILFGIDTLSQAGEVARGFGERSVIISEATIHDNPYMSQLRSILARSNVQTLVYDELQASSGSEVFHTILGMVRAGKPNCVIGIGGIKALTVARTIASIAPSNLSIERFFAGEVPGDKTLPFIAIPGTCRDHFLAQSSYVMTDNFRRKPVVLRSPAKMERVTILDPKVSTSLSPKYYAVVMMDVFLAAIEAFTSSQANFLSDGFALRSIEILSQAMIEFSQSPKDIRPRLKAAEAGLLSSLALSTSTQGIGGALSYAINSRYAVPKSWVATALVPLVLDLHGNHQPNRVAALAKAMGEDVDNLSPEDASLLASKVARRIVARLDLPSRLRDFHLSLEMVPEICELALDLPFIRSVPFSVNQQVVSDLVRQAF